MAIPDFQSIFLPLLELAGDGQNHRVSDTVDTLALRFSLTTDDMNELLPSGTQPRFRNRVNWAATHLRKAGLLESSKRAHIRITDRGRSVLADSPPKIDVKFLNQFPELSISEPLIGRIPQRQAAMTCGQSFVQQALRRKRYRKRIRRFGQVSPRKFWML